MFPTHIRAMVLDGPIDPSLDFRGLNAGTAAASQRQLDRFLDTCAEDVNCAFSSDGTSHDAFDALMARFSEGPIDGVTATVAWAAVTADLAASDANDLAVTLENASHGDASHMESIAGWMFEPSLLDAFDAVTCADFNTPRTPDGFAQLAADISGDAPDFGPVVAYQSFDCAYWPVESQRLPRPVTAEGAPPILVIAATGDPLTPYEWGQALVGELSSGVLLTRDGDGHTSLENWCVSQISDSYLLTFATPEPGATCT